MSEQEFKKAVKSANRLYEDGLITEDELLLKVYSLTVQYTKE
mgnify:CR=1 FL=1